MKINKDKLFKQFFTKSDQTREIKYLVLHHIGGYDEIFRNNVNNIDDAIETLKKHQVSAHYIIDVNGDILQLVVEEDIAYHAGYSYWRGEDGINQSSIGIEFFNPDPLNQEFSKEQIKSAIELCKSIISRYNIKPINIVGHSDIGYFSKTEENKQKGIINHLNRKDDPSHLFPWKELAANGVGLWPQSLPSLEEKNDKILLKVGDKGQEVAKLKKDLNNFGYKIANFNDMFDEQLNSVIIVFNRRFNPKAITNNINGWSLSSKQRLSKLLQFILL